MAAGVQKKKRRDRPGVLAFKAVVFVNAAVPLGMLVWDGAHDQLGVNPIDFITKTTGTLTLVFLLATLAVSTGRRLGLPPIVIRVRRMLGLWAFFYGFVHFMTYVWLDQFFHVGAILQDVLGRPFVTVGMLSFLLLMVPMAVTSTDGWIRKLGGKRWRQIHQRVYMLGFLAIVHYWMIVKVVGTREIVFAGVLAALLGERLVHTLRERRGVAPAGASE